ncbi:GNAT family N-acetyltransferase [Roseibium sp.]|uniref:GNAT family N-acetyltransferase n=1 Tax=Roseibium sp. TaxID=1936156 RepID=UPI0039F08F2F
MGEDVCTRDENRILVTERLVLRPPELSDAEDIWPLVSDSKLTRFLAWEPHREIADTRAMIASLREAQERRSAYHWIISENRRIVGLTSLIDLRMKHLAWVLNRAELAYWIAPENQGQGLATEAAEAVLKFGFLRLGLKKIRVAHASKNAASKAVAEKLGFKKYCEERKAFRKYNQWHSLIWYDLLREEFM